jgi:FkbM family methyltransferase
MLKKIICRLVRSLTKITLPILSKIFIKLRINRRIINYLNSESATSNNSYNFSNIILNLLQNKKLNGLDVGAQGGFNSDFFFAKRYNNFFEPIMVEPIKSEAEKLKSKYKYVIDHGLWSSSTKKDIFILGNRLGSSSMYKPDKSSFKIYNLNQKNMESFKITETIEIDCLAMSDAIKEIGIQAVDYLKIDTQGSELEILKGMNQLRPLLIRIEVQIFSMYKNVPSWTKLLNLLDDLGYMVCEWRKIGSNSTRTATEMDMVFIPNYRTDKGKALIKENENKFTSLMLIFGQLKLLKLISKDLELNSTKEIENFEDRYFF